MAIISKIRNQSALLIGAVGISMLLFIVGGDFLSQGTTLFGGNQAQDLGTIKGEPVSQLDYEKRIEMQLNQMDPSQVNESTRKQVREQVWQEIILERVMLPEYNELGIRITPDELANAFVGTNPHPIVVQYFTDPNTRQIIEQFRDPVTQGLNTDQVRTLMSQVLSDRSSDGYRSWIRLEQAVKRTLLDDKYQKLISQGFYVTDLEAKNSYVNRETRANVQYVLYPYSMIADSTIEVSDSDIKSYYNEHKKDPMFYKTRASRSIEYVEFSVEPSEEDVTTGMADLNKLKGRFEDETDDSTFVRFEGDKYSIDYYSLASLPEGFDSTTFQMEVGSVYGPYQPNRAVDQYTYKLAKVMWDTLAADSFTVRHILLQAQKTDSIGYANAQSTCDSLLEVVKTQNNFGEMAGQYSDDPGSKENGGEYKTDFKGVFRYVPEFRNYTLNAEIGEVAVVETQFGFHIMEVTRRTEPVRMIRLGTLDRSVEASDFTKDNAFELASKFSLENNETEKFQGAGSPERPILEAGNLSERSEFVGQMKNARSLVQWAYKSEIGDVSEPIKIGNKYIVAHLTTVEEKGVQPLENVRDLVREEVLKEKKAVIIAAKLNEKPDMVGKSQAAQVEIQTAENVIFSGDRLPGQTMRELDLVGTIFRLPQGQISEPIKGDAGVYVVQVDALTPADDGYQIADLRTELSSQQTGQVGYRVKPALEKLADVEDNRFKIY
ncbi:MAG: peptidylprolyl isomerase [Salibacteraceae bacterium]